MARAREAGGHFQRKSGDPPRFGFQARADWAACGGAAAAGKRRAFDGKCNFCHEYGHRKNQCPKLDDTGGWGGRTVCLREVQLDLEINPSEAKAPLKGGEHLPQKVADENRREAIAIEEPTES